MSVCTESPDEKPESIDYLQEQRKQSSIKLKFQNELTAGNLVERDKAIADTRKILSTAWNKFKTLPSDTAPELYEKTVDEIEAILKSKVQTIGAEIVTTLLEMIEGGE